MIKQTKKIKLSKNFNMNSQDIITLPSVIKEKDVYSVFTGLLTLVKELANNEAKKEQLHKETSYNNLLKLYLHAVKERNMYKSLYLNSIKLAK